MNENLRPTFLTVLCILTFIGSGMGIFNSISSYRNAEMTVGITNDVIDKAMDDVEDQLSDGDDAAFLSEMMGAVSEGLTVENVKNLGIANGIGSLLTLIGAILMWSLDKQGFWLYLFGTIMAIIDPVMIYEGLLGMMAGGGAAFLGIIFCVLYYLNIKHLK
jgi:hypothetical protein